MVSVPGGRQAAVAEDAVGGRRCGCERRALAAAAAKGQVQQLQRPPAALP